MSRKRVMVVTGAASGIGRHVVTRMAMQGHHVLATDIETGLMEMAAREEAWPEGLVVQARLDVRDADAWEAVVGDWVAARGRLDVLLNVAGYLRVGRVQDTTSDDVSRHIDINLKGVIFGTQVAARQMVAQGDGHIINIASLAGVAPINGLTLYSTSKFGVRGFSLAARRDLAPAGVSVSVICPDAVQTPMLEIQEDEPTASLTFSGTTLSVEDVGEAVDVALRRRSGEVLLPLHRGLLAKVANDWPQAIGLLEPVLRWRGRRAQRRRVAARKG